MARQCAVWTGRLGWGRVESQRFPGARVSGRPGWGRITRRELAEEVLNDVMVVVWHEAAGFRHQSRLSTWMFGIAYHKALKALARRSEQQLDTPSVTHPAQYHEAPEDALLRREARDTLAHAVQALPPAQRAVVELAFYHGFSYRDIAEIVDCPVNTVKTRMLHARRRLAQLLPGLD